MVEGQAGGGGLQPRHGPGGALQAGYDLADLKQEKFYDTVTELRLVGLTETCWYWILCLALGPFLKYVLLKAK